MPELDIVLFGATGYTGRLTAEYLAKAGAGARIGLAGRSPAKLEALKAAIGVDWPVLVADSHDRASLEALVAKTRVVCTTVGPYAAHGTLLVAAAAEHGVHYCDLTGETPWIRESVRTFHARARDSGARIVHCAGFDSVPSDLGCLVLHEHFARGGRALANARFYLVKSKGGVSGGTIASAIGIASQIRDPAVRRALGDPYALYGEDMERGEDRDTPLAPRYDERLGAWCGPFVMAAVNTRIVRRSNALLGYPYGVDFRYSEEMRTGRGLRGRISATALSAGLGAFAASLAFPPTRALLARTLLPKPGEGPSAESRTGGHFTIRILGESDGDPAQRAEVEVRGQQDPGYGETAKMLGESALCLALDALASPGGVLTPASAMGMVLVDRLRRAGMVFEAKDG